LLQLLSSIAGADAHRRAVASTVADAAVTAKA
jgi:hypothetical protein